MTITRRKFLKKAGLAAGGAIICPQLFPPVPMVQMIGLRFGMIGTGDHGINWNLAAYLKLEDCSVTLSVTSIRPG